MKKQETPDDEERVLLPLDLPCPYRLDGRNSILVEHGVYGSDARIIVEVCAQCGYQLNSPRGCMGRPCINASHRGEKVNGCGSNISEPGIFFPGAKLKVTEGESGQQWRVTVGERVPPERIQRDLYWERDDAGDAT